MNGVRSSARCDVVVGEGMGVATGLAFLILPQCLAHAAAVQVVC